MTAATVTPAIKEQMQLLAEAKRVTPPQSTASLTDEQKTKYLAERGIVVGATVIDPQQRVGEVTGIGRAIKPHSKKENKGEDFYVTIFRARRLEGGGIKRTETRVNFDHALTLQVVK